MEIIKSTENIEELAVDGIVLGCYSNYNFTEHAGMRLSSYLEKYKELEEFNDEKENILLYYIDGITAPRVVIAGLGKKEELDHEKVRIAANNAVKLLRKKGAKRIAIEVLGNDGQSTSEGVLLGLYEFIELKSQLKDHKFVESVTFVGNENQLIDVDVGIITSEAQNKAHRMANLPANHATPTIFTDYTKDIFKDIKNTEIIVHNEEWAKEKKMGSFLSVAAGTDEPAKFLEIHYNGTKDDVKPLVLVGKGITFDSGGISLKSGTGMGLMRGDCTGASVVINSIYGIAKLGLKLNVIGLTPLTENLPSGKATKPADVVVASNGKSIEIDNTDAEGRLILADALIYSETFNPFAVIDIATLTGSMMSAISDGFIGGFSRSDVLWSELEKAGIQSHERYWRMPLDKHYKKQIKSDLADVKNTGGSRAGAITAALFLAEFIELEDWVHLDIAGVSFPENRKPYHPNGVLAFGTRSIIQYARNIVSKG